MGDESDRKHPLARCESCSLQSCHAVYGRGPDRARIVVVGEAPGVQEHKLGSPFVGPSGKLISKVLEHHGIALDEVYFTNTVLCHPPKNRKPTAKESRLCRDRLVDEVKAREPEYILALGNSAAQSLLETRDGITKLRQGGAKEANWTTAPVVCTYHPAAALRNQALFPDILLDVGKLAKGTVQIGFEPTKWVLVDERNVNQFLQLLDPVKFLVADVETTGLYAKRDRVLTLGISHRPGAALAFTEAAIDTGESRLRKLLEAPDKQWCWQNGKFDIQFWWARGTRARVDQDTLLRHYALDERTAGVHDLGNLATQYCNAPDYKAPTAPYIKNMEACPKDLLHEYVAWDCDMGHRVHEALLPEFNNDAVLTNLYNGVLIPGSATLSLVEYDGIRIDESRMNPLRIEFGEKLQDLEQELLDRFGLVNPRSPNQVKDALTDLGIRGITTTDAKFLTTLLGKAGKPNDFAELLLQHRGTAKLLGTYVEGLLKRMWAGRLYSNFMLHGTETGRLSSRNPNLQNIPRDSTIRSVFAAGPGCTYVSADYSQAELRVLAVLSGDKTLQQVFRDRRSLHKEVALRMYGANYSESQYVRAKAVNFGIAYGREAGSLAQEFKISFKEAQRIIDEWFILFPQAKQYLELVKHQALHGGVLESPFGRRRRFTLITNENRKEIENQAMNFPMQSTASDLCLISGGEVQRRLPKGAGIRILVHDALVVEVPDEHVHEVALMTKAVMEQVGQEKFDFPFDAEVKIGPSWGELHEYC